MGSYARAGESFRTGAGTYHVVGADGISTAKLLDVDHGVVLVIVDLDLLNGGLDRIFQEIVHRRDHNARLSRLFVSVVSSESRLVPTEANEYTRDHTVKTVLGRS